MALTNHYRQLIFKYYKKYLIFLTPLYGLFLIGIGIVSISNYPWNFQLYIDAKQILSILSCLNTIIVLNICLLSFHFIDETAFTQFYLFRRKFQKNVLIRVFLAGFCNGIFYFLFSSLLRWFTKDFPLSFQQSLLSDLLSASFFCFLFSFIYYMNQCFLLIVTYFFGNKTLFLLLQVALFCLFSILCFHFISETSFHFSSIDTFMKTYALLLVLLILGTLFFFSITYCFYQKTDLDQRRS